MAYTPLKVHIPQPCHEDWKGMSPVSGSTARHCASCVKNVVDFTGFTDAQMYAYLRDNPGKVCGRFRPDQIDRPIRAAGERRSHPLRAAAAAAGLLLASSGCTTENNSQDTLEASRSTPEEYTLVEPPRTGGIALTEHPEEEIIEITAPGMVDGTPPVPPPPPPLVDEAVLETAPHPEPERIHEEEEMEWIVGDIEIMEPEIREPPAPTCHLVPPPPPPPLIDTAQTGADLLGLVVIDYPQPTGMDLFLDTIKSILPPSPKPTTEQTKHLRPRPNGTPPYLENLTLFPNPFVEFINVEIDVPEATSFTVRMIDNAGRQITSDRWNALPGYNAFILRPPQRRLKGGTYYVQITDDTGHSISRAVIRQ